MDSDCIINIVARGEHLRSFGFYTLCSQLNLRDDDTPHLHVL